MPRSHDPLFWFTIGREVLFLAIAVGVAVFAWHRTCGARHWPITHGRVEYGMTSDEGGWKSNLCYSYSVNGEFYSGVFPLKARSEAQADDNASKWKGQNITVRYSPGNPAISTIRLEDQAPLMTEPTGVGR